LILKDKLYIYILTLLYISDEMSFADLQRELERSGIKTTKGNLQHHLDKLKERGFIEKRYVPFFLSKRKVVYKITDEGIKILDEFIKELIQLEKLINSISAYKYIYFPYDELWEKVVKEAEKRKIKVHEMLKEIIDWYFNSEKVKLGKSEVDH
jgi:DNA-binding PadR family transcriptional regulator